MSRKIAKLRIDKLLVSRGFADSLSIAQAMIMAGSVEIPGIQQLKSGTSVDPSEKIEIRKTNPYVSRGGLKLESAMSVFGLSCEGLICMDIGASTGGFTDYMLQHGAQRVYALDVGKGLLDQNLINNPKVVNMESNNFRYFISRTLKEKIEFVTIDVSFISLKKILPKAVEILADGGQIVAMVKPQFETEAKNLRKGIVKDEETRQIAISEIREFSENLGLEVVSEADSKVKGPRGNLEHFLRLRIK